MELMEVVRILNNRYGTSFNIIIKKTTFKSLLLSQLITLFLSLPLNKTEFDLDINKDFTVQ